MNYWKIQYEWFSSTLCWAKEAVHLRVYTGDTIYKELPKEVEPINGIKIHWELTVEEHKRNNGNVSSGNVLCLHGNVGYSDIYIYIYTYKTHYFVY